MSDVLPAVPLPGPDCTSWGAGHNPHPIQVKLAFQDEGSWGSIHLTPDGVVFVDDDGGSASIASHRTDQLIDAAARLGPDRWRLSHSLLVKERTGISVANGIPLGLCLPRWARNPKRVFRVGRPRSGGPVRRQHWLCNLSWGCDECADGTRGWRGGLAAKLRDLAPRGPHLVRITSLADGTAWLLHVDGEHLEVCRLGSAPMRCSVRDAEDVAAAVADSFWDRHPTLEVDITPEPSLHPATWEPHLTWGIEDDFDGSLVADPSQGEDPDRPT